jgi:hypothetical protein
MNGALLNFMLIKINELGLFLGLLLAPNAWFRRVIAETEATKRPPKGGFFVVVCLLVSRESSQAVKSPPKTRLDARYVAGYPLAASRTPSVGLY